MRILLVEDDQDLGEAIVKRLRRDGHAADWQATGEGADGVLQYQAYDVVVLDIGLPRMDGFEVLLRMRRRGCKTPVLVLTARSQIEDRVGALDLGADDNLDYLIAQGADLTLRNRDGQTAAHLLETNPNLTIVRMRRALAAAE